MNTSFDTTISSLRIRGPAELHDRMNREIQSLNWPQANGDEYVFVRSVLAQADADRISGMMIEQAQRSVRYEHDPEKVMRFASRTTMLAALLADLARGYAGQHWYWKRWSRLLSLPAGKAIASVMADEIESLNALVEALHARNQAATVWQALGEEDAAQLIREISWKNKYQLPETQALLTDPRSHSGLMLPRQIQQRWLPMLGRLPERSPRFTLAALLIAQQCMPLRLSRAGSDTVAAVTLFLKQALGTTARTLNRSMDRTARVPARTSELLKQGFLQARQSDQPTDSHMDEEKPGTPEIPEDGYKPASVKKITTKGARSAGKRSGETGTDIPPSARRNNTVPAAPSDHAKDESATARIHTLEPARDRLSPETANQPAWSECHAAQGGVLYLLNFLNRGPVRSIMDAHWQTLPSGWMWVYRVACLLQLDEEDAITPFLAAQLGMEDASHLQLLPPLPQTQQIKSHAWNWYGNSGLWQPELLNLPARIRWNASHTDMFVDASRVNVNLRLAGLDLNPGWLPWVGQVVQFHFTEPASTGKEDQHE